METVLVRHNVEKGKLVVSVKYNNGKTRSQKTKDCNFEANLTDPVFKILGRITDKFSKLKIIERNKQKTSSEEEAGQGVSVALTAAGQPTDPATLNTHAWTDGAMLTIDGVDHQVSVNPPFVRSLKLPDCLLIGCPIQPRVELEEGDITDSIFLWYKLMKGEDKVKVIEDRLSRTKRNLRYRKPAAVDDDEAEDTNHHDSNQCNNDDNDDEGDSTSIQNLEEAVWTRLHEGHIYTPQVTDLGHKLRVVCTPRSGVRAGPSKGVMSKVEVVQAPESFPFEKRHQHTNEMTGTDRFRVVCYNILADLYGDSDYSREVLYPYCPAAYLKMGYRRQVILKELLGYHADIICLQEVDKKFFYDQLESSLARAGYQGAYRAKRGHTSEGCATFHRTAKLKLVDRHDLNIVQSMTNDSHNSDLWEKVCVNESLTKMFTTRRGTLQITILESIAHPNQSLLVATTHFYYHPKAPYIRLLQCIVCLRHIKQVLDTYKSKERSLGLVFCGDLNSLPESGVHQLLTQGHVTPHHPDWYAGGLKDYAPNLELSQPLVLTSCYGYPRYTNFVSGFCGSLDYIYMDADVLSVEKVIPLPCHEDVTANTALPSVVFPSDHLALICDLKWGKCHPERSLWERNFVPILVIFSSICIILLAIYSEQFM